MRHARRGGHSGHEFGGSGEDSFVAVVVTKLTGALLFILLLTMVIMALLPKAVDAPSASREHGSESQGTPLKITTPDTLPEAIAGRPYQLALAATGGQGTLKWSLSGPLPEGLALDAETGLIHGTPAKGTPKPAELVVRASDGSATAVQPTTLLVYQSDKPLSTPAWWKPAIPPIPWKVWLEQGFGFLLLWLVHLVGMNTLGGLERWRQAHDPESGTSTPSAWTRFTLYRGALRLSSLSAALTLGAWLWFHSA